MTDDIISNTEKCRSNNHEAIIYKKKYSSDNNVNIIYL